MDEKWAKTSTEIKIEFLETIVVLGYSEWMNSWVNMCNRKDQVISRTPVSDSWQNSKAYLPRKYDSGIISGHTSMTSWSHWPSCLRHHNSDYLPLKPSVKINLLVSSCQGLVTTTHHRRSWWTSNILSYLSKQTSIHLILPVSNTN